MQRTSHFKNTWLGTPVENNNSNQCGYVRDVAIYKDVVNVTSQAQIESGWIGQVRHNFKKT